MTALIVHGGAWPIPEHDHAAARAACEKALTEGVEVLETGRPALDVVEVAVKALEDAPMFDAGTGSHPSNTGEVEMDAIIVDGKTLEFGSVAAVQNVRNPIAVARHVMEQTPHAMLVGHGASRFAHESGFEFVEATDLTSGKTADDAHGTVGAVALDSEGHIAAATSTGGARGQLLGRVGDSPLIGSGAIADDRVGGVSCTGWGEYIMRAMMARTALDFMRYADPMTATYRALQDLKCRTGGQGGLIAIDAQGRLGYGFTTPHMAFAALDGDGRRVSGP